MPVSFQSRGPLLQPIIVRRRLQSCLIAYSGPGGVASAAEAVIHEPLYFVGFRFKILRHRIVHKFVAMRFQKHSHTCLTVTLWAWLRRK